MRCGRSWTARQVADLAVRTLLLCHLLGGLASGQLPERWILRTTIGADERQGPAAQFSQITSAAFVDDTTFVVTDAGDCSVRFFHTDGRHLRSTGRRGAGPGEFTLPAFLAVDTIVRVFDPQQHRVVLLDRDGEHLGTHRVVATRAFNVTRIQPVWPGLMVGATTPLLGPSRERADFVIFSVHDRTGRLDTIAEFPSGAAIWSAADGRQGVGMVLAKFGPAGAVGIRDSVVAIADGYSGEVRLYVARDDSLHLRRTWSLGVESRPVTKADVDAATGEWRAFLASRGARVGQLTVETPARWSVAHRVIVSADGRIWVLVGVGGPRTPHQIVQSVADDQENWIVLSSEGPGTAIWLPPGMMLMDTRRGLALVVRRDQDGLETVQVYDMP